MSTSSHPSQCVTSIRPAIYGGQCLWNPGMGSHCYQRESRKWRCGLMYQGHMDACDKPDGLTSLVIINTGAINL